ncbi:hypothetical protein CWE22_04420 [Pseudidiomarina aestuarii]|uniref:Bacteriophage CI repressor n=1 Tax=Pseudidiomarina aestuarii TaxID=624146 RepID=A0A7Z6ZU66_9GAMM|nr:hypothetical protein [Pseudidiomarina aestuarii]RUO41418.1 hypothetical protein CWE22_04420 [Pseudidiomarina aestuarii]
MSNDNINTKIESFDVIRNKSHTGMKSKVELPDLEECMYRLRLLSGEHKISHVMRWLGVSATTYANWKRRGNVNYSTLVEGLLRNGISLDWFFAPNQRLHYPQPGELGEVRPGYDNRVFVDKTLAGLALAEPILKQNGVPVTEATKRVMLDTFMLERSNVLDIKTALEQVGKALAVAMSGPQQEP